MCIFKIEIFWKKFWKRSLYKYQDIVTLKEVYTYIIGIKIGKSKGYHNFILMLYCSKSGKSDKSRDAFPERHLLPFYRMGKVVYDT